MTPNPAQILLHPVRLRIVLALQSAALTTTEIAERLPDIAHATLYRQVAMLADAGLLEVVGERRIRGGVERRYALVAEAAQLTPEQVASSSPDELLRAFTIFAGTLIEAMGRYLDAQDASSQGVSLSFRQAPLWLDDDELATLVEQLRETLGPYLELEPTPERRRLLLGTVLIPDVVDAPERRLDDEDTN